MQILHWPLSRPQPSPGSSAFGRVSSTTLSSPLLVDLLRGNPETRGIISTPRLRSNSNCSFLNSIPKQYIVSLCATLIPQLETRVESHSQIMEIYLPGYIHRLNSSTEMDMDFDDQSGRTHEKAPVLIAAGDERRNNPNGDDSRPPGDHYKDYDEKKGRNPPDRIPTQDDIDEEDENEEEEDDTYEINGFKFKHSDNALLIVNLYSGERNGYTFSVYLPETEEEEAKTFQESHLIPYSEKYLLNCVNSETVPVTLMTKLEKMNGIDLMRYRNCVVCEVRDFRRFPSSSSPKNEPVCRQIILRPNNQTLLSDLDQLIEKSHEDRSQYKNMIQAQTTTTELVPYDPQEIPSVKRRRLNPDHDSAESMEFGDPNDELTLNQRHEIEKKLVKETAGGLCLDPSKQVGLIANRAQYEKLKWNSKDLTNTVEKWARKKRKLEIIQKYDLQTDIEEDGAGSASANQPLDFYDREFIENTCKSKRDFLPFYKFVQKAVRSHKLKREPPKQTLQLPAVVSCEFNKGF